MTIGRSWSRRPTSCGSRPGTITCGFTPGAAGTWSVFRCRPSKHAWIRATSFVSTAPATVNVEEVREVHDKGTLAVELSDGTKVAVSRSGRAIVEAALLSRLRPR